jgi:hypothetical protein
MRYIGLDLALTTAHKAVVLDEKGQAITNVISVKATTTALEQLFQCARETAPEDDPLVVVMEPNLVLSNLGFIFPKSTKLSN